MTTFSPSSQCVRTLAILWLLVAFLAVDTGCREDPDGDGDVDADTDGDGDGDGDVDADADADGDSQPGCHPELGGPCHAVDQCDCADGEQCDLTVVDDHIEEVCEPAAGGTAVHGEECAAPTDCAPGHICLSFGTTAACMRLCVDHSACPERSLCSAGFTMDDLDPLPYRACSIPLAEADAAYGVCLGAAGACPDAGSEDRLIDGAAGADWSCTIDISNPDEVSLSFELSDGDIAVSGSNLTFPFEPSRVVAATCDAFSVTEAGTEYAAGECMVGYPTEGNCVVNINFSSDGWVGGTFRCLELSGGGGDLLSTMNGAEIGAGTFGLRACDIIGE